MDGSLRKLLFALGLVVTVSIALQAKAQRCHELFLPLPAFSSSPAAQQLLLTLLEIKGTVKTTYHAKLVEHAYNIDAEIYSRQVRPLLSALKPLELAELYNIATYAHAVSPIFGEVSRQFRYFQSPEIRAQRTEQQFDAMLGREFGPVAFLGDHLKETLSYANSSIALHKFKVILDTIIQLSTKMPAKKRRVFLAAALQGYNGGVDYADYINRLSQIVQLRRSQRIESGDLSLGIWDQPKHPSENVIGIRFSTDPLFDVAFGINYSGDRGMKFDSKTRTFAGSGVSVQTSYETILLSLSAANPAPNAKFIDLGSGFGRVGLTFGILRPDMTVEGYEYVPHRVAESQAAAERLGLKNVAFRQQDLSDKSFEIPEADIYYMYDPFSVEAFDKILAEIDTVGRRRPVTVIATGNAAFHFMRQVVEKDRQKIWSSDEKTFGTVYRSAPN